MFLHWYKQQYLFGNYCVQGTTLGVETGTNPTFMES